MTLREAIGEAGLSLRAAGAACGISKSAMSRLVANGEYPARRDRADFRAQLLGLLESRGVIGAVEWPERMPVNHQPVRTEEIELMQLDRAVLGHYGLKRNPFLNDVETDDDVFAWKGHTAIVDAIRETIEERAFLAVIAPSGAGKTTIWDTVEADAHGREDVVFCRPALKNKELLTPEHLVHAMIYGLLGEEAVIAGNAEKRGRQLSRALMQARNGVVDRRVVLVIDDAHYCGTSVLRQLKTFFEEKVGRYRLMAIVLIGLPPLKEKLQRFPEIGNRIRLCEVPPVPVKDYLEHKLRRAGSSLEKLFDPQGLEAFLARFRAPRRNALGWPLVINATVIRAMCKLHESGPQPGERISREIVDLLPSGSVIQTPRAA
ncbi:MAG: AAA family ATPase [Bryobacteraceae bacterium]|nr:AAA family ATPase [Bryobacteraceae bacterium]